MKRLSLIFTLFVAFMLSASAQQLMSAADLAKNLKNSDYIVVSAELEPNYSKVHITNAVNVPYKAFFKEGDIEGILVVDDEIKKIFGDNGVSESKTIVVYDEGSMKYGSRVAWILKYMGAPNVYVLDGGMNAWKAGRKPVTKNPTMVKKTTFNGTPNKAMIAGMDDVKAALADAGSVVVDARETGEYKGLENKSTGHIKGAVNVDHNTIQDDKSLMKAAADLEKLFKAAGVTKDKKVILYCSTGVRTAKEYIALTEILGYPNVKVYDGGFNEWTAKGGAIDK
ncbi:MAG: sulfurtransferase [Bacteroidetes bacterium]|nr:sulfurtransferase [Bacteroidota bacterium]MBU1580292.1 sulfurtransferase [Bacteroidota bacterium]MBU2465976.1 sulfurtransferase [Bacteroidota bacterium]MBU2556548.1 sulfurtransferase [Bacteroidota bacterium]